MIQDELGRGWHYYQEKMESGDRSLAIQIGARDESANQNGPLDWTPSGYPRLLKTVGRFANPHLDPS